MATRKELALRIGGVSLSKMLGNKPTFLKRMSDGSFQETEVMPVKEEGLEEERWPIVTGGIGFSLTVDFIVRLSSKQDPILEELLAVAPSMVAFSDFMRRQTSFRVGEEDFEFLVKLGHIV